jgi:hypothetical protein
MSHTVLFKIESLHVRTVQDTGLKFQQQGQEFVTGTVVAHLDAGAASPANMGMVDLDTGAIELRWGIIAALPFLADAFASGQVEQKDSSPVRVSLEEAGRLLEDGSGFEVQGTGQVSPGSFLSSVKIPLHNNIVQVVANGRRLTFARALSGRSPVRCTFLPASSYLDVTLPKALGAGKQRLNLKRGFVIVPVMTLARTEPTKRSRR